MKHIKTFEKFNYNSINENEDLVSTANEVQNQLEEVLSTEEINFLSQVYKENDGKEIIAKGIEDVSNKKNNEAMEIPTGGDGGLSAKEIKLRQILDKVIKYGSLAATLAIVPAAMAGAPFVALGLGIAGLVGCTRKDAAWWKNSRHHYNLQNKYGLK